MTPLFCWIRVNYRPTMAVKCNIYYCTLQISFSTTQTTMTSPFPYPSHLCAGSHRSPGNSTNFSAGIPQNFRFHHKLFHLQHKLFALTTNFLRSPQIFVISTTNLSRAVTQTLGLPPQTLLKHDDLLQARAWRSHLTQWIRISTQRTTWSPRGQVRKFYSA